MKRIMSSLAAAVLLTACGVGGIAEPTTAPDDALDSMTESSSTGPGSPDEAAANTLPDESVVDEPTTETQPKPSPTTTSESGAGDNLTTPMTGLVEAAIEDLANRLNVEASAITLIEAREVTWPNSSIGCPQPDRSYLQVLTPGSLIKLESGGVTFEYHAGPSGSPFYCATPTPPSAGGGGAGDY